MTRPADPPTPEALLAHREWMRAIARSLVGDENAVDDVEQRTWLTVLRNRRPVVSVRGWLRHAVRSAAADEFRSASRRRAREEASARPESLPPTDHLAAQAEAQRAVAAAVTGLPEPYRTTVLLRYFEELSLDEVAARMGVPLETVRTRLRRAHALLRDALDREFGDRRKWALVLLPLTRPRHLVPIGAATGGALLMAANTKTVAAVAAAVLLLTAAGWWAADVATRPDDTAVAIGDAMSQPVAAAPPRTKSPAITPKADDSAAVAAGIVLGVDVADATGRPVAGARVAMKPIARDPALGPESDWGDSFLTLRSAAAPAPSRTATTSEGGTADVAGLAPGAWRLVVSAEGFATSSEPVTVTPSPGRRHVVLVPGCALTGLVLLPSGAPAAGADVFADQVRAVADATGRFRFAGLPAGVVALSAGMPRGALQQTGDVTVPDVRDVTLRLAGGCALQGRVVDDATGAGIGGARVVIRATRYDDLPRMLRWGAETTTAVDGSFAMEDLPQGSPYVLWALADGFAACRNGREALGPYAALTPGGTTTVELRMSRGGVVKGRVFRADGSPVEGAVVDVLTRRGRERIDMSAGVLSGPDGSFRVLASVGRALVRAKLDAMEQRDLPKDPYTPVSNDTIPAAVRVDVSAKDEASIDLVMVPASESATGTLSGVVRREDGESARGALVRAGAGLVCTAAADGSFVFEHLAPRQYWVTATAEGCAPGKAPPVEVAATGVTKGVEVVLPRPLAIAGRVVGEDGAGIAGASVGLDTKDRGFGDLVTATVTAEDGAFVVRGLGPGQYIVTARADGFANGEVVAAAGSQDVVLQLEKARSIGGAVVDAVTGEPVAGVKVSANHAIQVGRIALYRSATTDAAGRFEIGPLASGLYNVWFGAEYESSNWVGCELDGVRAGDHDVKVALTRGAAIDGRVTDGAGDPVAGGLVAAYGPLAGTTPGLRVRLVRIQRDGTFVLPGLAAGAYDVEATPTGADGAELSPVRARNVPAGTHDVVLESRPSLVIEGRFLDDDGKPFPLGIGTAELLTYHPNGSMKSSTGVASQFNPDGSFRTQPLDPAETYDIVVTRVPGHVGGAARGLHPGQRGVDIVVRTGGRIAGRVLDASGNPVPAGVDVIARAVGGRGWPSNPGDDSFAKTDADGRFTLTGIDDRPYHVEAGGDPSDFIRGRTDGTVSAGATDVELRLERGASISGRLVDAKGEAMRSGWVQAERSGTPVLVDKDGRFTLRALKPGRYTLYAQIGQRIVELGEAQAPSDSLTLTVKDE
jgi:RNA polymerase sigma-70 factor (ECF subfamily)